VSSSRPPRPTPLKRYGQNHLVDTNTLKAIVRMAAVQPDDVVLEVGPATGQLTKHLVAKAALVHAFEIDARFADGLQSLATEHTNLRVHMGDALKSPLDRLDPAPTALVANLAYNIAIPLIMTTIVELPSLHRWAVMVQKELGERLFAEPSTKAYSAVSVLAQLACRFESSRFVARSVFSPQPRVDSLFVTFVRREAGDAVAPADYAALSALVRRAFSQRRKLITNSLAGLTGGGRTISRDEIVAALAALSLPPTTRPEELTPPVFIDLARELKWI